MDAKIEHLMHSTWALLEHVRCVGGTIADLSANMSASYELPSRLAFLDSQWKLVQSARHVVRDALLRMEDD